MAYLLKGLPPANTLKQFLSRWVSYEWNKWLEVAEKWLVMSFSGFEFIIHTIIVKIRHNVYLWIDQFFNFCESRVPGIKCFFVSSKKIMENERKLKRRFAKAKLVKGTMQFHAVIAYDSNHAFFKQYSYSDIMHRKLVCD